MRTTTKVNKENYELYEFMSGYFGICEKNKHGGGCVFGGDSANKDDYNKEYMTDEFNAWDGSLEDGRIVSAF